MSYCYVSADCLRVAQKQIINNCRSYSFPLITGPELHISFIPSCADLPVHWQAEIRPWHTQIPCDSCTKAPARALLMVPMVGTYWSVLFQMPQSFFRGV